MWPLLRGVGLVCGVSVGLIGPAFALDPSGTTVAVIPSADAQGQTGRRVLEVMGPVFMGDRVNTGPQGEAQIKFRDNTRLVVGPNSRLTIDAFVFDANNSAREVTMNALKGAFRFITGNSRKQAYSIRTPSATIGIRGTRFDFVIEPSGQTTMALFEGEARICNRQGDCREVRGSCAVAVVPPMGEVADLPAGEQRAARLRRLFPYVVSQARLLPDFQVDVSGCRTMHATISPDTRAPLRFGALPAAAPPGVVPPPAPPGPEPPPAGGGPGPSPSPSAGNPGNNMAVGQAGETPNGGNWGGGSQGRGDASNGNGNGNGGGNGNGNGGGNGNGNNGNGGGNGNGIAIGRNR